MKRILFLVVVLTIFSCEKNPPPAPEVPEKYDQGVLILNEGLYNQNNATLSFFDGQTSYQDVFQSENNRGLGDVANDFEAYSIAGRDFVIMAIDLSSQIEIIDRYTLKSVAQIPLFDGTNAREPRRVLVKGFYAYVCNFDGTVAVVDLITNQVIKLIEVGANPDGMVLVKDKLYVSNSGGLQYPVYDSTMSVINTGSNTVETSFKTRINCTEMVVDGQDEIYLVSNGNYDDIAPALLRIDTETNAILNEYAWDVSSLTILENWLYFYNGDTKNLQRMDTNTEEVETSFSIDLSGFETFYGFHIDPIAERIYCVDANGYVNSSTVSVFTLNGDQLFDFQAGLLANDLIFNHK
jgi:DNA-binding beta-propeller fold protein YncE